MADTEPKTFDVHPPEEHSVTAGGTIEFLAGRSDKGIEGIDRGLYSRFSISYGKTLDSGLDIAGRIAYHLNQRNGSGTGYAPDVLFVSVGGGFGTISAGAHARCRTGAASAQRKLTVGGVVEVIGRSSDNGSDGLDHRGTIPAMPTRSTTA